MWPGYAQFFRAAFCCAFGIVFRGFFVCYGKPVNWRLIDALAVFAREVAEAHLAAEDAQDIVHAGDKLHNSGDGVDGQHFSQRHEVLLQADCRDVQIAERLDVGFGHCGLFALVRQFRVTLCSRLQQEIDHPLIGHASLLECEPFVSRVHARKLLRTRDALENLLCRLHRTIGVIRINAQQPQRRDDWRLPGEFQLLKVLLHRRECSRHALSGAVGDMLYGVLPRRQIAHVHVEASGHVFKAG